MRFPLVQLTGLLLLGAGAAVAQDPGATVVGRVVDGNDHAIAGATVELGGGQRVYTDSTGAYRLPGVPSGVRVLRARRLGYVPAEVRLEVPASGEIRADLRLTATAQHLGAVEVRDRSDPSESRLSGFRGRAERRSGGGHFVTRAQLDARANTRLIEILRTIPGVRIRGPSRFADRTIRLRGASCAPLVFVDGFPATAGEFELDLINASTLEGVELYPGLASVPAEFQAVRGLHRCGVIAVWSRPPPSRQLAWLTHRSARVAAQVDSGRVYRAEDVDQAAVLLVNESPAPLYPDSLWKAGVGGDVVIEAIIDTAGRVEQGSMSVVSSSSPAFAVAALAALRESAFASAYKGSRRVRQVVHVPFRFDPPARTPEEGP